MKRIWAVALAIIFALSLTACNGAETGDTIDKNDSANYIGVWESEHKRFTISKGNVGRYEQPNTDGGYFDFTYKVEDDVLTIYIDGLLGENVASFELDNDGTTLTILHDGLPGYHYEGETEFTKVVSSE